jgi:prephenate dehydratase
MKIAIQGEAGSFSSEAAYRMVANCTLVFCARSTEVFDALDRGSVQAAVIPIENSLAGSVAEHFDLLLARTVFIQREFRLRIVHNLIAAAGVRKPDVRRVYSHPVALDQCRDFFRQNPQMEPVPFYDTAGSVKHIIESGIRDAAAIAGRRAGVVYHGKILVSGIEDEKRNFTRFFLIRKHPRSIPAANKTSIVFTMRNVPGALCQALEIFAINEINLAKIESRPIRGKPWQYSFYADLLCGNDIRARRALRELRQVAERMKVLGIYPAAQVRQSHSGVR